MKYIYANLKRFDIPVKDAGLNNLAQPVNWGEAIAREVEGHLKTVDAPLECVAFLPEAHIIPAMGALEEKSPLKIGCQGVYRKDTAKGENFGAFTTQRTGQAMKGIGCTYTIIGHCEERADKGEIMALGGSVNTEAVNMLLNSQVLCAQKAGMTVLYCIGEKLEEQDKWEEVITQQLTIGLQNADLSRVRIAYEPVWAIGPGRPVPDAAYIQKVARLCKKIYPDVPVLYGGGLKHENAPMLAGIQEVDGGLVGLTRFTGDIGFYPQEFVEIIQKYLSRQ